MNIPESNHIPAYLGIPLHGHKIKNCTKLTHRKDLSFKSTQVKTSVQLDPETRRAFVNVPDARQVAVVDMDAGRQTASWRMPDLRANFPMALDTTHSTIAVVFRNPARLVVFDVITGRPTGTLMTCGDADDVFFDAKRRRAYVSCGTGNVDAWQLDRSTYRRLSLLKTASGARTSLFVPDLDRLFVAARAGFFGLGSDAAILVLRPAD